jgi:hypothetical protein
LAETAFQEQRRVDDLLLRARSLAPEDYYPVVMAGYQLKNE